MKKNSSGKRGPMDPAPPSQTEKLGWIRKFCGRGIFREIWKNRFVILRGDQLFVCEKEVKELGRADEVLDLSDYDRCEEIRKNKSRSKKNHSKFRLQRCSSPGNTVPNLVFLAVSPEEKESWINVLNAAITRAKNRILDQVTVEDGQLSHLTRDRVKIPHNRRLPTRGHLLAVASTSSSDGMLTLDFIQEDSDDIITVSPECRRSQTDAALSLSVHSTPSATNATNAAGNAGKSRSLPRDTVDVVCWEKSTSGQVNKSSASGKAFARDEKNRCASMEDMLAVNKTKTKSTPMTRASIQPIDRLQDLIGKKLEKTERLLSEVQYNAELQGKGKGKEAAAIETVRGETERLLKEATAAWNNANEVLGEVKELRALYKQLGSFDDATQADSSKTTNPK